MSTSASREPRPRSANAFAVQITTGSRVTAKRRRDRVDGKGDVGGDDRNGHQQQWRAVETAPFANDEPATAKVGRDRDGTTDKTEDGGRGGVGLLRRATEDAIGDIEEQDAECLDDGFHTPDQRYPGDDRHAAEQQRAGDANEDDAASQLGRHEEVGKQKREQEHVVERERALDQVDRRPLAGGTARQRDSRRDRYGEDEPAGAPGDRLAAARRLGANRRSSRPRPATTAKAAAGARASSIVARRSVRGHGRQCRPRSGRPYGRQERGDVVGAVVASAVDEERGRTRDAAQVGAVDILGHARGPGVL